MQYCCAIDLDWLIRGPGAQFHATGCKVNGKHKPKEWWQARATILKAQGFEVLPYCSHHDKRGWCLGHAPQNTEKTPNEIPETR